MSENKKFDEPYRPIIKNSDEIFQLANELGVSATSIVNYLVNTGKEVLKRSLVKLQDDLTLEQKEALEKFFKEVTKK